MRRLLDRRTPLALAVLVSLVVLFSPGSEVPSVAISDKLVHGALFAALAVTARMAGGRPAVVAAALVAYAGASEVLQGVLPIHRDAEWGDVLADVVGVAVGLLVTARNRLVR